jgi:hypothetical protein
MKKIRLRNIITQKNILFVLAILTFLFGSGILLKYCGDESLERGKIEQSQEDTANIKIKEPNIDTKTNELPIVDYKSNEIFMADGTACKGDSIKAWNEAKERAMNNLLNKLSEQEKPNAKKYAKVDSTKSTKSILTSDGWKATVAVFIYEKDLKRKK